MTFGKLYLAKWLENTKRRNWTFLLCAVMAVLFQPVMVAINLTNSYNRYQEELRSGVQGAAMEMWHQNQRAAFLRMCCYSEEVFVLIVLFAVLFAVQGFSWLYSRKKTDFYMSMPVSAVKRYMMIMGNGLLVFGSVYLVCEILCGFIGAGFGLVNGAVIGHMILSWFVMMLTFAAVYQVALTAVMLTGNVMTALLGCCVFFFYEPLVRALADQLKSTYFVTYCRAESQRFLNSPLLTPVANGFTFLENIGFRDTALYGSPYGDEISIGLSVLLQIVILLLFTAVWGCAAFVLYRKRKTESYGLAIAFKTAKGLIRFALLVPISVTVGLLSSIWAGDSQIFLWGGAIVGLLLGHAVIQLIYERDLRALKKRLLSLGASGIAAALTLAVFCFDLTGYDQFVPAVSDVERVSVTVENDYSGVGRYYRVPFDGSRLDLSNSILSNMRSEDEETIQAVVEMAENYVTHLKTDGDSYGTDWKEGEDFRCWIVRYELKGGREIYRRFYSDANEQTEQINAVMQDEKYQKLRCQLFDPAFAESLGQMKIVYSTGVMDYLYTMDKETLYQAFAEEMRSYDYDLISGQLPKGSILFSIPRADKPDSNLCSWEFPVYEAFDKTLELIGENGIPVWEEYPLQAEDIDSFVINYYYTDEEIMESLPFEQAVMVERKEAIVTIDDPAEIKELLTALYPQGLMEVTDSSMHRYWEFDSGYEIGVNLSAEGKQKRMDNPYMQVIEDKMPGFVIERVKDALTAE